MSRLTLPALLVQSAHAAAIVQGMPLRGSSRKAYKTVECRGPAAFTEYRGAVAIFASKSYQLDLEDHYIWWHADQIGRRKRGKLQVTTEDEHHVRAWCRYTSAWRYRLVGFVRLEDSARSADILREPSRKVEARLVELHKRATDYSGQWMDPLPAVYWSVRSIHETTCADGPSFDAVCAGCNHPSAVGLIKPHNPTACHVNVQSVCLDRADVPAHVQKEIKPWPLK